MRAMGDVVTDRTKVPKSVHVKCPYGQHWRHSNREKLGCHFQFTSIERISATQEVRIRPEGARPKSFANVPS
jgi:hypothetical protein